MKRLTLTLCIVGCVVFSCNDSKTTDTKTSGKDSGSTTTTDKKTNDEVAPPMDSAAMMKAWQDYMTPGSVQQMMAKWNGSWSHEITMWMSPDAPPQKSTSSSVNRMILGGRYQESRITGNFDGMPFEGISIMGYDNHKKEFQSSWIDNMGTGVMYMKGTMDSATHTITLKGTGVDPMTGKDLEMRQTFVVLDDNNQKMEMFCTKDGKEMKNMEMVMKRK